MSNPLARCTYVAPSFSSPQRRACVRHAEVVSDKKVCTPVTYRDESADGSTPDFLLTFRSRYGPDVRVTLLRPLRLRQCGRRARVVEEAGMWWGPQVGSVETPLARRAVEEDETLRKVQCPFSTRSPGPPTIWTPSGQLNSRDEGRRRVGGTRPTPV